MAHKERILTNWTAWAYVLVCAPLVLLVVEMVRGSFLEIQSIRAQALQRETERLKASALSRAAALNALIREQAADELSWPSLADQRWLKDYWAASFIPQSRELYAAVVDESGRIVLHSDPRSVDQRLERDWYERHLAEDPQVVWVQKSVLSGEKAAYDIGIPLTVDGRSIGEYHQGLDKAWSDASIAAGQRQAALRWLGVLALVAAVDGAAVAALIYLARKYRELGGMIRRLGRKRVRELAQLGAGLAHEVRNPLHALRINLHTLRRSQSSRTPLSPEQIVATIDESDSAIDRLDGLMRDLLQFSDPAAGISAEVNVVQEVQATLNLLAEDLRREQIEVNSQLPRDPSPVVMDAVRLRQALLNVLTFAQSRAGKNGKIDVEVTRRDGGVEIGVCDSGPELPEEQQARVFEPFQAQAETGCGLGLALVQAYVEEAGGRASWNGSAAMGSRCRLWLPLAHAGHKGGKL